MAIVEVVIGHYHDLVAYLGTRNYCDVYHCSSILLGQLVREMMAQGIFSPRPSRPFLGFSTGEAIQMTLDIESPDWKALGCCSPSHRCRLGLLFQTHMSRVQAKVQGLDLDDFIGQS